MIYGAFLHQFFPSIIQKTPLFELLAGHTPVQYTVCDWSLAKLWIVGIYYTSIKFIYSEKATKFCEIPTLLFTDTTYNKSKVEILQNFVAFSEYMNFKIDVYF